MEPSSPQPSASSRLQLVPWTVLPIVLLPLLLLLTSGQSGLARSAIEAGQAFRTISIARLFEDGNPVLSALTLAVLDWQSVTAIGLFALGLLAVMASILHARDGKSVARTLIGLLVLLIIPVVMGLLLIGPVWDGYGMPTSHMELVHFIVAAGGLMVGQIPITLAVGLWAEPSDRPLRRAAEPSAVPDPVIRRGRWSKILLGSNGVEASLLWLPILVTLGAWAVLRFRGMLPDGLLLVFIEGAAIIRPLTVPELIGWIPQTPPGLDPLQDAVLMAFRDWQGLALSLAFCGGLVLSVLESRRAPPEHRAARLAKSLFLLGLFGAFFYWYIGDILRPALDPSTWEPEIATIIALFLILAIMGSSNSKQRRMENP